MWNGFSKEEWLAYRIEFDDSKDVLWCILFENLDKNMVRIIFFIISKIW